MEQKHIVLVDDETSFRSMLRKTLEAAGYRVSEARNALGMFELGAYDLMLLDIKMPGIDGHKILSSLKEGKSGAAPILVMTGLSDPAHRTQALAEGADGFLAKPMNMEELLTTVADLLARAPAQ
jgi:DNA-binding response OmpR family regulator